MNNKQFDSVVAELLNIDCLSHNRFGLTPAELEVANWFVSGFSYKEIARSRGVQIDTVKTHIRKILAKTNRKSRVELIFLVLGLNHGLKKQALATGVAY